MKVKYSLIIIIWVIVLGGFINYLNNSHVTSIFAVREEIKTNHQKTEWELWCWTEYKNGAIKKKYIGYFINYGGGLPDRIETSLCI